VCRIATRPKAAAQHALFSDFAHSNWTRISCSSRRLPVVPISKTPPPLSASSRTSALLVQPCTKGFLTTFTICDEGVRHLLSLSPDRPLFVNIHQVKEHWPRGSPHGKEKFESGEHIRVLESGGWLTELFFGPLQRTRHQEGGFAVLLRPHYSPPDLAIAA
jgi:hypothetical protein